ncbi:AI-2E family transporter [Candidatus Woesearchaeota archaeon]|nr:AI-2E family transporter [Candidatus Woesearchaeota archaeon]
MERYRQYIPLIVFSLLLILSFFLIKPFLIALVLAALFAYLFHPLFRWIRSQTRRPTLSSLIVCGIILLILVVPSVFFIEAVVKESFALYVLVKQKLAIGLFRDCVNSFCLSVKGMLHNPSINQQVQQIMKAATEWVVQRGSQLLLSVPRIVLNLIVMFFGIFYFLREGEQHLAQMNSYFGFHQQKYALFLQRIREIVHGIVFGYLLVAFIQGAIGAAGFFLFGVSSPLFWGMMMALLALIPFLGTGLVWLPASALLFLDGMFQNSNGMMAKGIGLFFYGLIFIAGIDNILKPKLIGEKAKIHPAIVMVGIFGGLLMFGPLGVIIGPLLLSVTWVIIETSVTKE